jgi:hypothetical protein
MFTSEAVQCNTSLIQPTNPNPSVYSCFSVQFLPEHKTTVLKCCITKSMFLLPLFQIPSDVQSSLCRGLFYDVSGFSYHSSFQYCLYSTVTLLCVHQIHTISILPYLLPVGTCMRFELWA